MILTTFEKWKSLRHQPGVERHAVEDGVLVGEEVVGGVVLGDPALVQHHHAVVVHDRVQPVGDGQHLRKNIKEFEKYFLYDEKYLVQMSVCGHRAVAELPPDGGLHQVVRLQVHCGRGLVQDQHLNPDIGYQK